MKTVLQKFVRKFWPRGNGAFYGTNLLTDLRRLISCPDPVCFDIGANVGQSIRMMEDLFSDPQIHAFEPSATTFEKLRDATFRTDVKRYPFALGSHSGTERFYSYESSKLRSLLPLTTSEDNRFRDQALQSIDEISVKTVDEMVFDLGLSRIDLMKIDTQGFDLEVLKGAEQSLTAGQISVILIELNNISLYSQQATFSQILDWLAEREIFLVDLYNKRRRGARLAWCDGLFVRNCT